MAKESIIYGSERARQMVETSVITYNTLKGTYPEICGLILWGSIARGKADPNDVDLRVFFDEDKLMTLTKNIYDWQIQLRVGEAQAVGVQSMQMMGYMTDISERLKSWLSKRGVQATVVSSVIEFDYIDRMLNSLKDQKLVYERYGVYDSTSLCELFHYGLDPEVRVYRAYLLDRLSQMGEEGEELWRKIIHDTEIWQVAGGWTGSVKEFGDWFKPTYPQDLSSAKEYFI